MCLYRCLNIVIINDIGGEVTMTVENNILSNIFPELFYVVDRVCTPSWRIKNTMINYNIMFVYDGEAEFSCNNETRIGKKGDFIFYKPGDMRFAHTFEYNPMKCFAVDFSYTCPVFDNGEWKLNQCELPFSFIVEIEDVYLYTRLVNLFSGLYKMWLSKKKSDITKIKLTFIEILSLMIQYKECRNFTYSDSKRVEEIINYLIEHYNEKIKIDDISDKMQLSSSYIGNIFKRVTGKSIIKYLLEVRISKAKDLLRDGNTVSETAHMVGFNDIFYFSKVFKKLESITPSQYKRENI